jgi:hypothetical protein
MTLPVSCSQFICALKAVAVAAIAAEASTTIDVLAMAFINLVILRSVWRSFRAWKRGEPLSDEIVSGGGVRRFRWRYQTRGRTGNRPGTSASYG